MKRFHLNIIIYFFLLAGLGLYAFTLHRAPANDRYRPGDWVSYGVNRYISSVARSQPVRNRLFSVPPPASRAMTF